jgi:serine/threonine-protein kinase
MPLPDILQLGITLAEVLDHLHQHGVIHCDIKPSNIGFAQNGVVKLLDFGLARVMHETRVATTGRVDADRLDRSAAAWEASGGWFGTPHFMSPEAALGQPPAPAFDLWALAVVLYEAIAGRRPFEGQSAFQILARIVNGPTPDIRSVAPDTPPAIADFLADALSLDGARRPISGAVFANELRGLRAIG